MVAGHWEAGGRAGTAVWALAHHAGETARQHPGRPQTGGQCEYCHFSPIFCSSFLHKCSLSHYPFSFPYSIL